VIQSKNGEIDQIRLELQISNQARLEEVHERDNQILNLRRQQKEASDAATKATEEKNACASQASSAAIQAENNQVQLKNQLSGFLQNITLCSAEINKYHQELETITADLTETHTEKQSLEQVIEEYLSQLDVAQSELKACTKQIHKDTKSSHEKPKQTLESPNEEQMKKSTQKNQEFNPTFQEDLDEKKNQSLSEEHSSNLLPNEEIKPDAAQKNKKKRIGPASPRKKQLSHQSQKLPKMINQQRVS